MKCHDGLSLVNQPPPPPKRADAGVHGFLASFRLKVRGCSYVAYVTRVAARGMGPPWLPIGPIAPLAPAGTGGVGGAGGAAGAVGREVEVGGGGVRER